MSKALRQNLHAAQLLFQLLDRTASDAADLPQTKDVHFFTKTISDDTDTTLITIQTMLDLMNLSDANPKE